MKDKMKYEMNKKLVLRQILRGSAPNAANQVGDENNKLAKLKRSKKMAKSGWDGMGWITGWGEI